MKLKEKLAEIWLKTVCCGKGFIKLNLTDDNVEEAALVGYIAGFEKARESIDLLLQEHEIASGLYRIHPMRVKDLGEE